MRRFLVLFAVLAFVVSLPTAGASALSYPVTTTLDASSSGTLRWAIGKADEHPGEDSIPIEVSGLIALGTKLPAISDDVTITGPSTAPLDVSRDDAAAPFRILEIVGADVTISRLTVRGGLDTTGGGILNAGGNLTLVRVTVAGNEARNEGSGAVAAGGGGIFSNGTLTLRDSFVNGNLVAAEAGEENLAAGGGVESEGTLFVERSTISNNLVEARGEGEPKVAALGGGLALTFGSTTTIAESTISENFAFAADATDVAVARGGGIQGGVASITGSTVAENGVELDAAGATAANVAGDNLALSSISSLRDTIVAVPRGEGDNCSGTLVSGGFNLDEDGSCELGQATDLESVVAGLDPVLKLDGGPTPTHALLDGSAAIDRGNSFGFGVDQRGLPRPSDFASVSNTEGGDGSDIGAFELQAPATPAGGPVLVAAVPSDTRPPDTRIVSGPPRNTYKREAKFRFASTEAQSHFACRLDKKKWRACANPFKRSVRPGKHVFKVRAIDRFGNVDQTPARFGWRVKPLS